MRALLILSVVLLAGCASSITQVRERAAVDLRCNQSEISVELTERPYVGVTRYRAEGCGDNRGYECHAWVYSGGLPLGKRTCRRAG